MSGKLDRFKRDLLGGQLPAFGLDVPTQQHLETAHMTVGFELGLLKVVKDEAYYKATRRRKDIVVYTEPLDFKGK